MTLRARLALGFLAIALLLAVPLIASQFALRSAKRAAERLRDEQFAASLVLSGVRKQLVDVDAAERGVGAYNGDSETSAAFHRATRSLATYVDSLRLYRLTATAQMLDSSAREINRLGEIEIAAFAAGEKRIADTVSTAQIQPALDRVEARISAAEDTLRMVTTRNVDAAAAQVDAAATLASVLGALALVVGAGVAYWTTRSISRPVRDLERGMAAVAGGDFGHALSVAPGRSDEFGRLAASYESMAHQLAELDKLKAEFVSVASHELKTPINVMMGYLKLFEENIYGPLNEKQTEVVGTMQTQAASMGRLVQHLLDISRFQAGEARLEPKPMQLTQFLQEMRTTHDVLAMQRGVTFAVDTHGPLPEIVSWDADRMAEVLGNLLTNAFKFTPEGGRVDLLVSSLEGSVYIAVRDTGVGIDAAQLPNIFDKFFQANNQHGASAKGTGLGLAITKEIVEAHGGTIAVESTVGQGTTFSIVLPVGDAGGVVAPERLSRSGVDRRANAGVAS